MLNADALKEEAEEEKALAKAAKDDIARRDASALASMAGGDGARYLEYGCYRRAETEAEAAQAREEDAVVVRV